MLAVSEPPRSILLIMIVLVAVEILSNFESSMIYSAIPAIAKDVGGVANASWAITVYLIVQAGTAAVGGRLGDIFGRRRALCCIIVICMIGSLISAFTTIPGVIVLGRAVQGLSGAILPLCYGIAYNTVPRDKAAFWIGIITGGYAIATGVGLVLGGALTDIGSWHAIFYCNAFYALAILVPVLLVLPRDRPPAQLLKTEGMASGLLFAPSVAAILFGLAMVKTWGWSPSTIGMIAGGLACLTYWARREYMKPVPLIDVKLLMRREILLANLCFALWAISAAQSPMVFTLLLQQPVSTGVGLGLSATLAAAVLAQGNFVGGPASPVSGLIAGRFGHRAALLTGGAIGGAAWIFLTFSHRTVWEVAGGLLVASAGGSIISTAVANLVLRVAPNNRSSEATGLSMVIKWISMSVGALGIGTLLDRGRVIDTATGHSYPTGSGYFLVMGLMTASMIAISLVALALPGRRAVPADPPADRIATSAL